MNKLLTVIIPSYNMEKYIERSVSSLITTKNSNLLEILIVNDGSTDCTSKISHDFEKQYPSIIKVIDKKNGNYGSCINTGLQNASGKYIRILDADDYYDTDAFEVFLTKLPYVESDVILTDYSIIQDNLKNKQEILPPLLSYKLLNFDSIKISSGKFQMHSLTYKTQLLKNIQYKQSEGISYTDQEWILFPFFFIDNIYYIPLNIYQYCLGREGQTMDTAIKIKKISDSLQGTIASIIYYYNHQKNLLSRQRQNYILQKLIGRIMYLYKVYLILQDKNSFDESGCKKLDMTLKKFAPDIYKKTQKKWLYKYVPYNYIGIWRLFGIRVPKFLK